MRVPCETCETTHTGCDHCQRIVDSHPHVIVALPYGSFNATVPMVLCKECHWGFIQMTFRYAHRELPARELTDF